MSAHKRASVCAHADTSSSLTEFVETSTNVSPFTIHVRLERSASTCQEATTVSALLAPLAIHLSVDVNGSQRNAKLTMIVRWTRSVTSTLINAYHLATFVAQVHSAQSQTMSPYASALPTSLVTHTTRSTAATEEFLPHHGQNLPVLIFLQVALMLCVWPMEFKCWFSWTASTE